MKPMKKVEMVVDALFSPRVFETLERLGIDRWTRIGGASGRGDRGVRGGGDPAGAFDNDLIIVVCDAERVPALAAAVRPLLRKTGGYMLVSDCEFLVHD